MAINASIVLWRCGGRRGGKVLAFVKTNCQRETIS